MSSQLELYQFDCWYPCPHSWNYLVLVFMSSQPELYSAGIHVLTAGTKSNAIYQGRSFNAGIHVLTAGTKSAGIRVLTAGT